MEQHNPSQPQPPSLSGAGNADGVLGRLVGHSVLVLYAALTHDIGE